MEEPEEKVVASVSKEGTSDLEDLKQRNNFSMMVSLKKSIGSSVEETNPEENFRSSFTESKSTTAESKQLGEKKGNPLFATSGQNSSEKDISLIRRSDERQQKGDSSLSASPATLDVSCQDSTQLSNTKAANEPGKTFTSHEYTSVQASRDSSALQAHQERDAGLLSSKIEELSKKITHDDYLDVPTSLISYISQTWQNETLPVLGQQLEIFYSKHQWQCVVVTLVLLKNIPLSTDDLKSHKEVARRVYALSRLSSDKKDVWLAYSIQLAKTIVTMWKKTVIEASKQEEADVKSQTLKRSRLGNGENVKKKPKVLSAGTDKQVDSDPSKNQKLKQSHVTLSDDALFGTSVPNVAISKRSTSSKLSSLSISSASPRLSRSTEDASHSVLPDLSKDSIRETGVAELSSKLNAESHSTTNRKKVRFAPPEKLVTVHEIENIEQLRRWEREEAGLSSVDTEQQVSSDSHWNETFEAHKKREREMEKSVFQAKSEHFVRVVREMKEEIEWRSPALVLAEHAVVPTVESVERATRERTVQLVPERYTDRNHYSPASPEHKPIELSPLQEIPLESIGTSSPASQQLSRQSNMSFQENQAASTQPSVNNFPSQFSFDSNSNVLQMLQQNPSVLQSLLSAFGASMTGNNTLTGAMQAKQSMSHGQQYNNGNDSFLQGLPSTSYSGTNLFSSGLSMVNALPSSQSNIDPMLLQQLTQQSQRAVANQWAFQSPGAPFFAYAQQNQSPFASSCSDASNQPSLGNVAVGSMNSYGSSQSIVKRSVDDKKTNTSKKSNICYFYNQGTCANGESCRFLHVKVPYKVPHPKSTKKSDAV